MASDSPEDIIDRILQRTAGIKSNLEATLASQKRETELLEGSIERQGKKDRKQDPGGRFRS